jgi:hypothetical protein
MQSPDGKALAFSSLTHLYRMDVPKGSPTRLVNGTTREFQPAWSPDGQWIAYVSWGSDGGHIWRARADGQGTPQQLTRHPAFYRDPVFSPDGSRIVALRGRRQQRLEQASDMGGSGLDVVWLPASGGDPSLIVPARGLGRPHFSKDKDRVYFYGGGPAVPVPNASAQGLVSIRYDGTDRRTHVKVVGKSRTPQPSPAQDIRLSPDGNYLLAAVHNQLYVLAFPMPGGEPPTINVSAPAVPVRKLTDVGLDHFAWSADGKTITWSVGSTFFRLPLEKVTFEPQKNEEGKEGEDNETAEKQNPPKPAKLPVEEIAVRIEHARHKPKGAMVLRGARAITMKGDEIIADSDIVITDNRIVAVGKRGSVAIPAGAKVHDLRGATVMPGIIDVHAHWFEIRRGVLDTQNWSLLANLAYGVTTGRDPQTMTNDMFAYQDLVDMGEILGPRAFSTGPGVFADTDFQSLEDAKNTVAKYKQHYRTHTLKSYVVGNRKQRQWMVEACKEHGIMPTTEGALDLKMDLTHVLDGFSGNEHAFPIVPLFRDVAELVARSRITYTPTLLVAYGGPFAENYFYETTEVHDDMKLRRFIPHNIIDSRSKRRQWFRPEEHVFPKLAAGAAKIIRSGGRVCIGGHGQLQGIQCHWEMWALQSGGLSNHEVLRAATLHGAEAIGYAQDIGSIEPGKLADILVLTKNPLENIRNTSTLKYVIKNGAMFEADTLNQVWPVERKLPELWWWNEKL